jgi:hypothetical protein
MSDIKLLIDKKKTNEDKLINIYTSYCGKYIRKIYNALPDKKIFLRNLIDISSWNEYKKEKEYMKFLKWCENVLDIDEKELNDLLHNTLYLSVEIIVYNYEYAEFLDNIEFISCQQFFHKSMKSISRFYYENFKKINASDKSKNELTEIISLQIHKVMPLKKIIRFIQESEENNPFVIKYTHKKDDENKSYMSNLSISNESEKLDKQLSKKINIEKKLSENSESNNQTSSKKLSKKIDKLPSTVTSTSDNSSDKSSDKSSSKSSAKSSIKVLDKSSGKSSEKSSSKSLDDSSDKSSRNSSDKSSSNSSKYRKTNKSRNKNNSESSVEELEYIPRKKYNLSLNKKNKKNEKNEKKDVEKYDDIKHISLKYKKY